ncbi:beta-N-acetylhexosaminidase [Pedobacter ginsengisoli]|uniref:beta-N-acetylhexosaminidase n=1 Tax=Pedobacter ginsengisoli TaxID=363852 RepID=A0A2D1U2M0_9SPHI|nr:family 20 glycosylhydrolase [Pedobacter ginsengisoli]ATP55754.1 beta-N-acetylhexosaminidase [Pedobacter ginsengisoli]
MNFRFFRTAIFTICMLFSINVFAAEDGPALIPQPVKLQKLPGSFKITKGTRLIANTENKEIAELFSAMIKAPTGFTLGNTAGGTSAIQLVINKTYNKQIGSEGYTLEVKPSKTTIIANLPAGLFYGMQTLMQLLPKEIESPNVVKNKIWSVPCVKIIDYPRFGWRGLMLDVSRHYFPKEVVKKYINQLAKYKMNVFHWHLTDDQGWRIEIKSLPQLTAIGAWRAPRVGLWWKRDPQAANEVADYGGYYTQEDVKEIVKYAQQRFVTILPEIDVPGHSLAALAAYPDLSCTGGPFKVNVGNTFYGVDDNALCPGNEESFSFMEKVLGEVAALFPGQYIHIGGDECFKGFWKDCKKCQKRMKDEKLNTPEELQSYFIRRMENIVKSKGKKMMGWDEILEGGLAPEATVMSWRGMKGGIEAAKMNHHVVMTPADNCYLDLYQGDPAAEPPTYSMLTLSSCYNFEPIPSEIPDPSLILGGQGNLWTESVPNYRHAEYMTWPRAFALAEVFWSQKERKGWDGFISRMERNLERYDVANINYARSVYDATIKPLKDSVNKTMRIALSTEIKKLDIYYTFDNTFPDNFSPRYTDTLSIPKGADHLRVLTYHNNKPIGKMITVSIKDLEKRTED